MNLQHINIKVYVSEPSVFEVEDLIKTFHRWIADQSMDEMLIDVADYQHVPAGPGIVLIGLNADYSMDNTGNRWGLRFNCKSSREGSNEDRFRYSFESATRACAMLESDFESLKFDRHEFSFFINDRGLDTNTGGTYESCQSVIPSMLRNALGHDEYELEYERDPRRLFGAHVRLASAWMPAC